MAEYAVSSILRNLNDLLIDEKCTTLLYKTQTSIKLMRDEFLYLEYILNHVEEKQGHRYGLQNWKSDVIRSAHEVEDFVETLVLHLESQIKNPIALYLITYQRLIKFIYGFYLKPMILFMPSLKIDELELKISPLKDKIHELVASLKTYGLQQITTYPDDDKWVNRSLSMHDLHLPRASTEDVVGFNEKMETLIDHFVNNDPPGLSTISITGMGGIGKTTLARCIYSNEQVSNRFQVKGWVSISQNFTPKGLVLKLITELVPNENYIKANLQRLQEPQLKVMLYEYLEQSRYLVVLDDVWSIQAWETLITAFPDTENNKGSRLILTTRNNQVAQLAGGITRNMSSDPDQSINSWKLFKNKAFEIHQVDPELEEIGTEIIKSCHDLPLLAVGVGRYLSRKTKRREWQRVLSNMTPLGPRGKLDHLLDIIALSYKDLGLEVKSFFLCLAFFPKNHEISVKKLVHIWIGLCLVSEDEATSMENKAQIYIQELIDKNLVKKEDKVGLGGKIKSCLGIHPSLHEFCILKAKEEMYLEVQSTSSYDNLLTNPRHKVIHAGTASLTPATNLRSLFFLPAPETPVANLPLFFESSKLLRVLDLKGLAINNNLLRKVGKLRNLRYLNLSKTSGVEKFHKSMTRLHRLSVLDIRGSQIVMGFSVVCKMISLRHVYLGKDRASELLKFENLAQLRTIGWISVQELLENDLGNLKFIQKLKLKFSSPSSTDTVDEAWRRIASLSQLQDLHLLTEHQMDIPQNISASLKITQTIDNHNHHQQLSTSENLVSNQ